MTMTINSNYELVMEEDKKPVIPLAKDAPLQLPDPKGYRLLVVLPKPEESIGMFEKAKETIEREQITSVVAFVLKMGEDSYKDTKRFPSGPWCKEGDFILLHPYVGSRFKLHGQEFRIINDNEVLCTVDDPRGYTRI